MPGLMRISFTLPDGYWEDVQTTDDQPFNYYSARASGEQPINYYSARASGEQPINYWDSMQTPFTPIRPYTFTSLYQSRDQDNNVQQEEPQRSTLPSLYKPNGQTSYTSNAFKQSSLQVPEREEPSERDDYNLRFKRSYTDLAQKISSRYPSSPRRREGAIGGTWRHVREVLGHGGSMLCYIDGMVSIHDNEALQASLTKRPLHPPYAPLREDFENRTQDCIFPRVDSDLERKLKLASMPKRKGHYRF